jgi:hypothetical protein
MALKRGAKTQKEKALAKITEPAMARRMFEMKVKGMAYHRIAAAFDVSTHYVHTLMQKYAKEELVPYVEDYRQVALERIEFMWEKLVNSGRLDKGDPAAIMAGNALVKRLSDQLGLDAPTKMEIEAKINPREIELYGLITAARRKADAEVKAIKGELPDDDEDIVDGELVEDD